MHPNRTFRRATNDRNIAFVRDRAFGTLAINGENGPMTSCIPALLSNDGSHLDFHLVRSNPMAEALTTPKKAVFLVNGPDSYVSPDWYDLKDQVPTWNYIAVRIEGEAGCLPDDALAPLLDRLSAHFEKRLIPKPPWTAGKMTQGLMERMMRSITACRLAVSKIDATWKLSQNKKSNARKSAAHGIAETGIGLSVKDLALLMREAD